MAKKPETGAVNAYFFRGIPADLWRKMKVKAAQEDTTIRDILIRLMADYVKK